jgi:hypothetical protein
MPNLANVFDLRRQNILRHHALLVVRLPAMPYRADGSFKWLRSPANDHCSMQGTKWYFDGSLLLGKWNGFRSTGFGIAVVGQDDSLLGYGLGQPPSWCATAASAEAWALQLVISLNVSVPMMRTDCLSLITTAQAGAERATGAGRILARIWLLIANRLDGNLDCLADHKMLVWQPAHLTLAALGVARLSDGTKLTPVDWRANRLVDQLAKMSAQWGVDSKHVTAFLDKAWLATQQAACTLGNVTYLANNFVAPFVGEDGSTIQRVYRDSCSANLTRKRNLTSKAEAKPIGKRFCINKSQSCTASEPVNVVGALPESATSYRRPPRTATHSGVRTHEQDRLLKRRVDQIRDSLRAPVNQLDASQRIAAVRLRALARFGGALP